MSGKDFTEYVIEKANDVVDLVDEMGAELQFLDSSIDELINDAVAAYREYLLYVIARLQEDDE